MAIDILLRLMLFAVLALAQILVLNRIQLFHCATPLLYVYFAITFPRNYPKWGMLLWCFALGFCIDVFSNTPGVASASLTLVAALQPYLLELFLSRDSDEKAKASALVLGFGKFALLAALLTFLYCVVFFALESFCLFNWLYWLECVVGSFLFTLVLILTVESIRK